MDRNDPFADYGYKVLRWSVVSAQKLEITDAFKNRFLEMSHRGRVRWFALMASLITFMRKEY